MTAPGTVLGRALPSLRLLVADDAAPLAASLQEAIALLVAAGRLRIAGAGERPDLLHTVGRVDDRSAALDAHHVVHTVDRIALRGGREVVPARRWAWRQRRRALSGTVWLAHGRTAGRIVVQTGAPGERVHCLPVLAPAEAGGDVSIGRQRARQELGLRPGLRLVLWSGTQGPSAVSEWASMLRRRGPSHLRVLRLPHGPGAGPGLSLASLLDAADLFVAAGQELTAVNPAVVALARGVPIITTITDSAADLVVPGRDGHLVDARPDAVAEAVLAHLDGGGLALRRRPRTAWGPPVQDLARGLLHAYADARSWPASWRPAAGR